MVFILLFIINNFTPRNLLLVQGILFLIVNKWVSFQLLCVQTQTHILAPNINLTYL